MTQQDSKDLKKALIVDDEPVIRRVCTKILNNLGFAVEVAENGFAALEILKTRHDFDICLTDVKMPGMDGIELFRYIQKEIPGMAHSVAFITGDVLSDDIAQLLEETNQPYVSKPFTHEDIEEIVKTMGLNR